MKLPEGMTSTHAEAMRRLPPDVRTRVMERAAIIWEGNPGMSWEEADRKALEMETGR